MLSLYWCYSRRELLSLNVLLSYSFKDGTLKELLDLVPKRIDERYVRRLPASFDIYRPQFTKNNSFHYIESLALV